VNYSCARKFFALTPGAGGAGGAGSNDGTYNVAGGAGGAGGGCLIIEVGGNVTLSSTVFNCSGVAGSPGVSGARYGGGGGGGGGGSFLLIYGGTLTGSSTPNVAGGAGGASGGSGTGGAGGNGIYGFEKNYTFF
jgi:hypothetical protein